MRRGRALAAGSLFLLLVAACAPPPKTIQVFISPSPSASPSPTPTVPIAASGPAFHVGEVGLAYSPAKLSATGGLAPYKWSLTSGAVPSGLTLGGDGTISGAPTTAGTFVFTVQVADSGNSTASVTGTISIAPTLAASLLPACAQYCDVELGCTTACGIFGTLAGGVAPYAYTVTDGTLPAGTSLSTLSLAGTFGGQSGWLGFTVQVTDALGATSSVSPKFWMYPHISLTGGSIPVSPNNPCYAIDAPKGACTASFPYSGGTPAEGSMTPTGSWITSTCAPLPALSASGGQLTIAVNSGLPNCNGWRATLRVVLTNQDLCGPSTSAVCSASADYTITVLPT